MEDQHTMNDRYTVRMPDGWRDTLKRMAAKNRRSINSEILDCLEPHVIAAMSKTQE